MVKPESRREHALDEAMLPVSLWWWWVARKFYVGFRLRERVKYCGYSVEQGKMPLQIQTASAGLQHGFAWECHSWLSRRWRKSRTTN